MTERFEKSVSANPDTDKALETSSTNPLGTLPTPAPKLEYHEYANLFPMFSDEERNGLIEDIRENGLREKIILLDGRIIDGRNRYEALLTLGIDPTPYCEEYNGDDPLGFVISKNLHRRHLDESQRAMVAARLANIRHGGNRKNQAANLPLESTPPITQAKAAEKLNVGERTVRDAKTVLTSGNNEIIAAVESGKESVSAAASKIRADAKDKAQRQGKPVNVEPPQEMAERMMMRESPFLLSTEQTDSSGQEFIDKVKSGEFNGKLYGKNTAKLIKAVDTMNATMEEFRTLFAETFKLVQSQEQEAELKRILDSMDESNTSLTELIAALRSQFTTKSETSPPDSLTSTSPDDDDSSDTSESNIGSDEAARCETNEQSFACQGQQVSDVEPLNCIAKGDGYDAEGRPTGDGKTFRVFASSTINRSEAPSLPDTAKEERKKLLASGVIDGNYTFVQDRDFSSPTAAAYVVGGYKTGANYFWKGLETFRGGDAQ